MTLELRGPPPGMWKTVRSVVTFADQWITLRSDHCLDAAGRAITPYHVLEYRDWVNITAITPDSNIVLVNEYKHGLGACRLGLPGGVIDESDDHPDAAAQRELLEETGFSAPQFHFICSMPANPETQTNHGHAFFAPLAHVTRAPMLSGGESLVVEVVPLSDFLKHFLRREIPMAGADAASILASLLFVLQQKDLAELAELRAIIRAAIVDL